MSTIIALADAEIASAYPTAGGLYYWASKLGSPGWGWLRAGSTSSGRSPSRRRSATASRLRRGVVHLLVRLRRTADGAYVYSCSSLRHLACCGALVQHLEDPVTAMMNTISAYWHMIGVAFIVVILLFVPDDHRSLSYVFTDRSTNTGFGDGSTSFGSVVFWLVLRAGPAHGPVHDHRLRRVGPHGRGDTPGVAHGRSRHVHGRGRVRVLRLHPAACRDVRSTGRTSRSTS